MDAGDSQDRWLDEQLKLRMQEVDATVRAANAAARSTSQQARTTKLQTLAVAAALVAALAAGFGAYQAAAAVRASEQSAEQQSADNQLSTAIAAIGGGTPAQRVAGMTLLDLNVKARISTASNALARQDAFGEYVTAVDVLTNYIREENPSGTTGGTSNSAGTVANSASSTFYSGYGNPASGQGEPFDVLYAAAQLRDLLGMQDQVRALQVKEGVGVDLTGDELWGLSWAGVNLGWVAAWMPGIDLRGANLHDSDWVGANVRGAFLQCADLSGADFAGAHLAGADLRGADVAGANFTRAHLHGVKLTGIFGKAKGLRRAGLPVSRWNPDRQPCDNNPQYWDKLAGATQGTQAAAASAAYATTTQTVVYGFGDYQVGWGHPEVRPSRAVFGLAGEDGIKRIRWHDWRHSSGFGHGLHLLFTGTGFRDQRATISLSRVRLHRGHRYFSHLVMRWTTQNGRHHTESLNWRHVNQVGWLWVGNYN